MNTLCLLVFLLCGIASAQAVEKIGDVFPIQFRSNGSSDDIKQTDTPLGRSFVLNHPGATYIALHFSQLNLLKGDSIEVSDANGGQAYTLTGRGKGQGSAFWSQHIKGDTIVLNTLMTSRSWFRKSVFAIDEYAAGFEAFTETICGSDDKENAACYASSFPTEYSKSKAVARLLINGSSLCTGFLVSESSHFVTNNHCIKSASDALNTDFEFMSETPSCGSSNSQLSNKGTIFGGATFIKTSSSLDYTLVQINNGNPASLYGFLELEDKQATAGGQIYIPQHPGGKAKQIAIFSSQTADSSDGFCHINSVGRTGCGSNSGINNAFYFCDTEGGSSGSPIISRSTNKVVGLHKCGGCSSGNHATSAHLIRNQISSLIPPPSDPTPTDTPPVDVPVEAPVESPVSAPVESPVSAPVESPTAPAPTPVQPKCLRSRARCSSSSKCCSGFCRANRRCR